MKIFDIVYKELEKACGTEAHVPHPSLKLSEEDKREVITKTYFTIIATNVENRICRELCKNNFFQENNRR